MNTRKPVKAEELETLQPCTLEELCLICRVDADWIVELIEHGVVVPAGRTRTEWRFERTSVVRLAKARRLQTDLDLNTPGVALALDLLDEIDKLRARLRALEPRSGSGN